MKFTPLSCSTRYHKLPEYRTVNPYNVCIDQTEAVALLRLSKKKKLFRNLDKVLMFFVFYFPSTTLRVCNYVARYLSKEYLPEFIKRGIVSKSTELEINYYTYYT